MVLANRTLNYVDDQGVMKDVSMTLLKRIEDDGTWRIGLVFGAPINWERYRPGDDVLEAITTILAMWWVRLFVGGMKLANNIRWRDAQGQESFNCGLPALRKRPSDWVAPPIPATEKNPGDLQVLSELAVSFPDENGIEVGRPLFVFVPRQIDEATWKCGFAFDTKDAPVRYGVGDDWIQAFLDAGALMRVVYDASLPQGYHNHEFMNLDHLPYKMGRGYFIDKHE
jgi:hypothetical protein